MTESPPPVIEMRDISVGFPGVKALDGVSFRMYPGEVHSLLGENGAGKSTVIKALTGVYNIDQGEILLGGEPTAIGNPAQAQAAGISTVYQEVNLLPNLSVAENIMLGREPRRFGLIDWKATRARAAQLLERLNLDIDPSSPLTSTPWRSGNSSPSCARPTSTPGCSSSTNRPRVWMRTRSSNCSA